MGLSDQVTAVLPEPPVTVATNCVIWPAERELVAGLTEMLSGARIVMIPDSAEIGTEVSSIDAPTRLIRRTTVGPDAVADNVTFTVATVPLGIVVAFIPHTIHRRPAQARDLPADVAAAPIVALVATTFGGTLRSHCSATG